MFLVGEKKAEIQIFMKSNAGTSMPLRSMLLTPRWIITTLLVIATAAGMARLGFWQLERLDERRAANASITAQINAPELMLNQALQAGSLDGNALSTMEYRSVTASGQYDPANEILLRNQVYQNMPGYHLITPLRIAGTDLAVLVDRGFIPMEDAKTGRANVAITAPVTLRGTLR